MRLPLSSPSSFVIEGADNDMSLSARESDETPQPKHPVRATHKGPGSTLGRNLYTSSSSETGGHGPGPTKSLSTKSGSRRKSKGSRSVSNVPILSRTSAPESSSPERPSLKIGHAAISLSMETLFPAENDQEAEGEIRLVDLPPSSPGLVAVLDPLSTSIDFSGSLEAAHATDNANTSITPELSQDLDTGSLQPAELTPEIALHSDERYSQNLFTQDSAPSVDAPHTTTSPFSFKATQLAIGMSDNGGENDSRASLKAAIQRQEAIPSPSRSNRSSNRTGQSLSERRKLGPTNPRTSPKQRKPVRIEETPCSNPETFMDVPLQGTRTSPTIDGLDTHIKSDMMADPSPPPFESGEVQTAKPERGFEPTILNDQSLPELVPKPTPKRTYAKASRSTPRRQHHASHEEAAAHPTPRHGKSKSEAREPSAPSSKKVVKTPEFIPLPEIDLDADEERAPGNFASHEDSDRTPSGSSYQAQRNGFDRSPEAEDELELDQLDRLDDLMSSSGSPSPDPTDETYVAHTTNKRKAPPQRARSKAQPAKVQIKEEPVPQVPDASQEPDAESDNESQSSGSTPRDPTDETFRPPKRSKRAKAPKVRTESKRARRETRSKPGSPSVKKATRAPDGTRDTRNKAPVATQEVSPSRANGGALVEHTDPLGQPEHAPLAGKVFLLSTKFAGSETDKKALTKQRSDTIRKLGGRVEEKWQRLFDFSNSFASAFDPQLEDVPFLLLLGRDLVTTPKFLICVAKGIPCLDESYLNDIAEGKAVDWRSYLVPTGKPLARLHRYHATCQLVDYRWGTTEWSAATAIAPRRPFLGKSFVFINSRNERFADLDVLVPSCLHALGAAAFSATLRVPENLDEYDFVLVENRDERLKIPASIRNSGKVGNTAWLKQCILAGALLPPALLKD